MFLKSPNSSGQRVSFSVSFAITYSAWHKRVVIVHNNSWNNCKPSPTKEFSHTFSPAIKGCANIWSHLRDVPSFIFLCMFMSWCSHYCWRKLFLCFVLVISISLEKVSKTKCEKFKSSKNILKCGVHNWVVLRWKNSTITKCYPPLSPFRHGRVVPEIFSEKSFLERRLDANFCLQRILSFLLFSEVWLPVRQPLCKAF